MSSPARALAILDLFDEAHPVWHPDAINEALGYTRATGYRYAKDLVTAGLLQKVGHGVYALGPRIIELDYHLRRTDPLLLAAAPRMQELVGRHGQDAVLTTWVGERMLDVYRLGTALPSPAYGRGRPRPLFRGAAPRTILSRQPRARLRTVYRSHVDEVAAAGLGASETDFLEALRQTRRAGFHVSRGELEEGVSALGVSLEGADGPVRTALTLVGPDGWVGPDGAPALTDLEEAARAIRDVLTA